ncbi:Chemotaxis protein methyltransferase [Roseivivax sp. THAF40]|uniref:CheR family methyltransferase n=1 Tax=unclassified Roseivivax TaxID=2639302 RepID=UPI001268D3CA|nr:MULTISPECIES: protein-glutamate O-methyltransferase [unclassified Roseivivax]QFS83204.1 Chemotaxis protein methyltransferase [Roseivivax sp. THAF197b]QFT46948.1 Chemotaxis protein methyltransferase [Roseivivax sp. THAF40]
MSELSQDISTDLDADTFARIAGVLHEISGIRLEEANGSLVVSRLAKRLRKLGLQSFREYSALVSNPTARSERYEMVLALTTNTTRFFREPGHFKIFSNDLLPRLAKRARAGGRVRIWSAGCASGEEAWCLAALTLKAFPDAAQYDLRILATDIDRGVLAAAEKGIYAARSAAAVPPDMTATMFAPASDGTDQVSIRNELRALVTFRYLNFVEPWPVSGPFDAIFCRNVAIYMDEKTQANLWQGLEAVLDPDGYLFLGHSERLGPGFESRLELFDKTSFRRPASQRSPNLSGM